MPLKIGKNYDSGRKICHMELDTHPKKPQICEKVGMLLSKWTFLGLNQTDLNLKFNLEKL